MHCVQQAAASLNRACSAHAAALLQVLHVVEPAVHGAALAHAVVLVREAAVVPVCAVELVPVAVLVHAAESARGAAGAPALLLVFQSEPRNQMNRLKTVPVSA